MAKHNRWVALSVLWLESNAEWGRCFCEGQSHSTPAIPLRERASPPWSAYFHGWMGDAGADNGQR